MGVTTLVGVVVHVNTPVAPPIRVIEDILRRCTTSPPLFTFDCRTVRVINTRIVLSPVIACVMVSIDYKHTLSCDFFNPALRVCLIVG